jgi:hypothetical protein
MRIQKSLCRDFYIDARKIFLKHAETRKRYSSRLFGRRQWLQTVKDRPPVRVFRHMTEFPIAASRDGGCSDHGAPPFNLEAPSARSPRRFATDRHDKQIK